MAKSAPLTQRVYVQGLRISGDINTISAGCPRAMIEVNDLESAGVARILSHSDGVIDISAWFNDATGQEHEALKGLPYTDVIWMWFLDSNRDAECACLVSKQINYDANRNQDGSLSMAVQSLGTNTPLDWCKTLTAGEETHASATSSTSRNDSAATSDGMIAYLEMREIDSGTPTILIEESSNNGAGDAFTTIVSFSAIADGAEPTAERVTVTGAIEQYLRVTSTGTFVNADFVVATRRGVSGDVENLS